MVFLERNASGTKRIAFVLAVLLLVLVNLQESPSLARRVESDIEKKLNIHLDEMRTHLIQERRKLEEREKQLLDREEALSLGMKTVLDAITNYTTYEKLAQEPKQPSSMVNATETESFAETTAPPLVGPELTPELQAAHDAWYVDSNNHNDLKVTIQLRRHRNDRLGSNVRLPLYSMAYAHCMGFKFCIVAGREGPGGVFNFPQCPYNLFDFSPQRGSIFGDNSNAVNSSGTYTVGNEAFLAKKIHDLPGNCTFSDSFRQQWRTMILGGVQDPGLNATVAQENLFDNDKSHTTIAVNIRRGDVTNYKRAIYDDIYVKLLEELRPAVERTGKIPEVHLFSEDYGMVDSRKKIDRNWTMYDGLVDKWHLAPEMVTRKNRHAMDMSLNVRDWKHFLKADILVVGGTFSEIPAFGRPASPDPVTGAGTTLYPCPSEDECNSPTPWVTTQYYHTWSKGKGARMDQLKLLRMPKALSTN